VHAWGQESGTEVGSVAQQKLNPLAYSIYLPATRSLGFGAGPRRDTQPTLRLQPRIPLRLTEDWRVISRSNVSIIHVSGPEETTGIGDMDVSLFMTPTKTAAWVRSAW